MILLVFSLFCFVVSFPVALITSVWTVKSNSIAPVYRFPALRETSCTILGVSGASSALLFLLVAFTIK